MPAHHVGDLDADDRRAPPAGVQAERTPDALGDRGERRGGIEHQLAAQEIGRVDEPEGDGAHRC